MSTCWPRRYGKFRVDSSNGLEVIQEKQQGDSPLQAVAG